MLTINKSFLIVIDNYTLDRRFSGLHFVKIHFSDQWELKEHLWFYDANDIFDFLGLIIHIIKLAFEIFYSNFFHFYIFAIYFSLLVIRQSLLVVRQYRR